MFNNYKVPFHSTVIFNDNIYVDPYKIEKATHNAKFIFITHSHYDHFSINDIKKIYNKETNFIVPYECKKELVKLGVDEYKINIVKPNNVYYIEGISFSTIKAYNVDKQFHPKINNWLGYIFNFDGENVAVLGDTDITEDNKSISCDLLFIPIGGTYTMNYEEASELTNIIKPKIVVPIHYNAIVGSKEDAEQFKKLVNEQIEVNILI